MRMIVLLETGPQTNQYHQFVFNKEQFQHLSAEISRYYIIRRGVGNQAPMIVEPKLSNMRFKMPPNIKTWYDEGEPI